MRDTDVMSSAGTVKYVLFVTRNDCVTCFSFVMRNRSKILIHRSGVPFTLGNTVHNKDKCYSYVSPYPCMDERDAAGIGTCVDGSLVNAVDLVMGQDGVLWVLDIGISNTLSDHPSRDGEPKIIGFEIATGKVNDNNIRLLCYTVVVFKKNGNLSRIC